MSRCVQNSDCGDGLECWFGLCTSDPDAKLEADSDPDETFPGTLHADPTDGTWARSMVGITMASPRIAPGAERDLIALVYSERLPIGNPRFHVEEWLIRFDGATGAMKWLEMVPRNASFAVDESGNVVLAWPTLLQRLDPSGELLWAEEREPRAAYERANVAVDNAGNILLARIALSESPGTIGGDPRGTLELQKLDPDGNELWSKRFGDDTTMLDDPYLVADASNNVVLLSSTVKGTVNFGGEPLGDYNVLAKYSPDGEHVFSKAIGGYGLTYYTGRTPIQTTPDGRIFFRNESVGAIDIGLGELHCRSQYLFEFDAMGAPLSNRCVHANDYALLPGGGFATAYRMFDQVNVGDEMCSAYLVGGDDVLVARFDASGALLGNYCGFEAGDQQLLGVLAAPAGALFLAGAYRPTLTLPNTTVLGPANPQTTSAMVAKIAPL